MYDAGAKRSDFLKGDFVKVDDAVFAERTAVVDFYDDGLPILGVGDTYIAPDREPWVRGRERPGETIP